MRVKKYRLKKEPVIRLVFGLVVFIIALTLVVNYFNGRNTRKLKKIGYNDTQIKVLKDKSGELPSLAYFKKVALSWGKDNVLSTADAVKYITTLKGSDNDNNRESIYDKGNYDVSGGLDEL